MLPQSRSGKKRILNGFRAIATAVPKSRIMKFRRLELLLPQSRAPAVEQSDYRFRLMDYRTGSFMCSVLVSADGF